jgi:hypothetical protein
MYLSTVKMGFEYEDQDSKIWAMWIRYTTWTSGVDLIKATFSLHRLFLRADLVLIM